MFLMVRAMATFLRMRRSVQPPELLLEQTLSMEILGWLSTSIIKLIIYGGMCYLQSLRDMAIWVQERTIVLIRATRNLGIMIALMIFGCAVYLLATEFISAKKSKGEILLFQRGRVPDLQQKLDEEANANDRVNTETLAQEKTVPDAAASIQKQTAVFYWDSVSFDINVKGKPRRLLDEVDGWVKPGTLTALMVYSLPQTGS
jgi:CDR ABC transporter